MICRLLEDYIKGFNFKETQQSKPRIEKTTDTDCYKKKINMRVKTRLKLIAVCIITERYLSILSQGFTKPLVSSTLWERKSHCCAACMFSFSSILPQGLWTYLNKTSSDSAALLTNSVRRQKEKIQFSTEEWYTFSLLFSYIIWHGRNKTYCESQTEQNFQQCIPGHVFWIIYL